MARENHQGYPHCLVLARHTWQIEADDCDALSAVIIAGHTIPMQPKPNEILNMQLPSHP